jgi:Transposase DDE domain group 1
VAAVRGRKKRRKRARRVRVGAADARLTPVGGLEAVRELDRVLGITRALDAGIGRIKERERGLTGGQVLMTMACAQLAGEDFMVGLDRRREDAAGQMLEPVPTPASTTWAGNAKRFTGKHLAGLPAAVKTINTEWVSRLPAPRRGALLREVTIDGDTTDVEVYGRTKDGAAHAYTGALTLRPHIAYWAEAGVPLAAELMGGTEDPRSNAVDVLDAAIAALPDGVEHVRCRWDAGYFAVDLANACIERGVSFAIGAKRTRPLMTAAQQVPDTAWVPAIGMDGTEVAVIDYLPGTWPGDAGIACIARRTRIPAERIPTARARKRRTIPDTQLTLALDGHIDAVYGYSFILTNLDLTDPDDTPGHEPGLKLAEIEWWYRHRTDIEALNKDAKHGAALRHLPSANRAINTVWMHAALLGCQIAAWMQELAGTDHGNGRGRLTLTRFRRELIATPARLIRRAGTILLRPPPGRHLLSLVLPRLQALPAPG